MEILKDEQFIYICYYSVYKILFMEILKDEQLLYNCYYSVYKILPHSILFTKHEHHYVQNRD